MLLRASLRAQPFQHHYGAPQHKTMLGVLYTLAEAAVYLRLTTGQVQDLAEAGQIRGSKSGNRWRFTSDDLDRFEFAMKQAQFGAKPIHPRLEQVSGNKEWTINIVERSSVCRR